MAFHQPLLPVLPVARELFSKTKLIGSTKAGTELHAKGPPPKLHRARALSTDDDSKLVASSKGWRRRNPDVQAGTVTALPLTDEPVSVDSGNPPQRATVVRRKRLPGLFNRSSSKVGSPSVSPVSTCLKACKTDMIVSSCYHKLLHLIFIFYILA